MSKVDAELTEKLVPSVVVSLQQKQQLPQQEEDDCRCWASVLYIAGNKERIKVDLKVLWHLISNEQSTRVVLINSSRPFFCCSRFPTIIRPRRMPWLHSILHHHGFIYLAPFLLVLPRFCHFYSYCVVYLLLFTAI